MKEYKFTEIFKLKDLLDEAGVPYEFIDHSNGNYLSYQICYPCSDMDKRECSAIQSRFSYGHTVDRIEIMGFYKENPRAVQGYLTAEDVASRIIDHYNKHRKEDTN